MQKNRLERIFLFPKNGNLMLVLRISFLFFIISHRLPRRAPQPIVRQYRLVASLKSVVGQLTSATLSPHLIYPGCDCGARW